MKILYYPIILICLALTIIEFIPTVAFASTHVATYQWLLYGMAGYFVLTLLPFVRKNIEWLQTFSHELTHTIVGLLFFRKIHSFSAEQGTGMMTHSGCRFGSIFISLSPYCLPIFTYAFLLLRIIGDASMLYVFDIFIGITLAFHISCFWRQTGLYQTDIQSEGYIRSFLFIIWGWVFNASVILLSIRKGIVDTMMYLFPRYWQTLLQWWDYIVDIYHTLVDWIVGWVSAL